MNTEIIPFHKWKDEIVKKDSKEHNVTLYLREKEWYYSKYSEFCKKFRKTTSE